MNQNGKKKCRIRNSITLQIKKTKNVLLMIIKTQYLLTNTSDTNSSNTSDISMQPPIITSRHRDK